MKHNAYRDKICWITGTSSGIGEALAYALSVRGARIVLSARHENSLQAVRKRCADPERVAIVAFDQADTERLPDHAESAWAAFGRLDYVFLNAGYAVRDTVLNTDAEALARVLATNFTGPAILAKAILPRFLAQRSGTFVVTSSLSGKYGIPKLSAYAASKHALHGYFGSLRAECAGDGIRVSMVIPGLIRTGIINNAVAGDGRAYGKQLQSIDSGMSPDRCAVKILQGVARGRHEVIVGGAEKITLWLNRFSPRLLAWVIRNHPLRRLRRLGFGVSRNGK